MVHMHHNEQEIADFRDPLWMSAAIRMVVETAVEPTFAELLSIPNFSGHVSFGIPNLNICVWPHLSDVAIDCLSALILDGEIDMLPCHPQVYLHANIEIPDMPLALTCKRHETQHWLPVKFRAVAILKSEGRAYDA